MELNLKGLHLNATDVETICRMVAASKAKEEIAQLRYFEDILPESDIKHLKELCSFDFTTMPEKEDNEYVDWKYAMDRLVDMQTDIFDVHYNMCRASYSMEYVEKYSIYDRMRKWAEYRHKDNEFVEEIINEVKGGTT